MGERNNRGPLLIRGIASGDAASMSSDRGPGGFASPSRTRGSTQFWRLTGTTRDSAGNALPGCTVDLFALNTWIAQTVSDGSGIFTFNLGGNSNGDKRSFFTRAVDPNGAVAGTSVNDFVLVAV